MAPPPSVHSATNCHVLHFIGRERNRAVLHTMDCIFPILLEVDFPISAEKIWGYSLNWTRVCCLVLGIAKDPRWLNRDSTYSS